MGLLQQNQRQHYSSKKSFTGDGTTFQFVVSDKDIRNSPLSSNMSQSGLLSADLDRRSMYQKLGRIFGKNLQQPFENH